MNLTLLATRWLGSLWLNSQNSSTVPAAVPSEVHRSKPEVELDEADRRVRQLEIELNRKLDQHDASFTASSEKLARAQAERRETAAEIERITEAALNALFEARDMGVRIAFVADPTLKTLKVLPKD